MFKLAAAALLIMYIEQAASNYSRFIEQLIKGVCVCVCIALFITTTSVSGHLKKIKVLGVHQRLNLLLIIIANSIVGEPPITFIIIIII